MLLCQYIKFLEYRKDHSETYMSSFQRLIQTLKFDTNTNVAVSQSQKFNIRYVEVADANDTVIKNS